MIVELDPTAPTTEVARLAAAVGAHPDVQAWPLRVGDRAFLVVSGDEDLVERVDSPAAVGWHATHPAGYWLVDRANGVVASAVRVGDGVVGDGGLWCAAGPCALESVEDAVATGRVLRRQGVHAFRVGVFKPRTGPYNFQGKGRAGLAALAEVRAAVGLPVVTEVLDPRDVDAVAEVADCLQVGTRNMTNQALLKELGRAGRPVLLKRGSGSPVVEWVRAAEFVVAHGNPDVVLCARGITSFDDSLRFLPDLGAVLAVRRRTALPVVFDPSHSAGRRDAVAPTALSAAAFGVDGLLVESHIAPERTYRPGDGPQAYPPDRVGELLDACATARALADKLGDGLRPGGSR